MMVTMMVAMTVKLMAMLLYGIVDGVEVFAKDVGAIESNVVLLG